MLLAGLLTVAWLWPTAVVALFVFGVLAEAAALTLGLLARRGRGG